MFAMLQMPTETCRRDVFYTFAVAKNGKSKKKSQEKSRASAPERHAERGRQKRTHMHTHTPFSLHINKSVLCVANAGMIQTFFDVLKFKSTRSKTTAREDSAVETKERAPKQIK